MDGELRALMKYKRIFGVLLCGGTLTMAFWLKKRKGERLKEILQDCTRVHVDEGIFDSKTSFYRFVMRALRVFGMI